MEGKLPQTLCLLIALTMSARAFAHGALAQPADDAEPAAHEQESAANRPITIGERERSQPEEPREADLNESAATNDLPQAPADREAQPLGRDSGLLAIGEPAPEHARVASASWLDSGGVDEVVRVGGALGVIIGIILVCAVVMRRFGRGALGAAGRPGGVLEVLARYPLGRRSHLLILKMDRRLLLLHQSAATLSTICEVRDPAEVASLLARIEAGSKRGLAGRFHDALTRAGGSYVSGDQFDAVETVDLTRSLNRREPRAIHRRQVAR